MSLLRFFKIIGSTTNNVAEVTSNNAVKVDGSEVIQPISVDSLPLNLDAFARLRISNPTTIFDSKQIYNSKPLFWDDAQVNGAGTTSAHNTNQASTTISVGAAAGKRVRQTFRHFNYQPGKSQLFIQTFNLGAGGIGVKKRVGLFNNENGIFLLQDETTLKIGLRTFTSGVVVDTEIAQDSWNIDKLDGTGNSGITLDQTKTLIFFSDFEWLGVGTVRYGFFIDGIPYYCHAIHNSNVNTIVYMSTPNLPLRYEIENDGTGAVNSLVHICSTVITEGGRSDTGFPFGLNRANNPLITNNDALIYPLISLRLNPNNLGAFIKLLNFTINCTSSATYAYYLIVNPTVTGTALNFSSLSNSSIQYDKNTTNATTISGGTVLLTDIATDTNNSQSGVKGLLNTDFALGSKIDGTPDIVCLGIQRLNGGTETFYASLNFSETN